MGQRGLQEVTGECHPAGLPGHPGQGEEPVGQAGVVVEHPGARACLARARGPPQPPVRQVQGGEQVRRLQRRGHEPGLAQEQPALGERGDREPVPGGDHLVVAARAHPLGAGSQQRFAHPPQARLVRGIPAALEHRAAAFERAVRGHAEDLRRVTGVLGSQGLAQFARGPGVEEPFLAVAVGVQRGGQPALAGAQFADHPGARLPGHPGRHRAGRAPPPVRVGPRQQGIVVEHLLEVRHHPGFIHAVAGEPAAELVVHAAPGHRRHGAGGHVQRPLATGRAGPFGVPEQELAHHRRRELGCPAEPAVRGVVVARQGQHRLVADVRQAGRLRLARPWPGLVAQRGRDPARLAGDPVPVLVPGLGDGEHEVLELGAREVGAAVERLTFRGHEHGHRPAALAGHGLGRRHVDRVHVGPFLPVHLDGHEVLVQQRRGLRILERLVRHHVAPVAGRVADRQHHRHVPLAGRGERAGRPRPPVHRVVRVLQEIGTRRVLQPVCHAPMFTARPARAVFAIRKLNEYDFQYHFQ